jgi:hypothetical protein
MNRAGDNTHVVATTHESFYLIGDEIFLFAKVVYSDVRHLMRE